MSKFIYRYRSFNDYTLTSLYKGRLSFSTLSTMNDEMEGYFRFDRQNVIKRVKNNKHFMNKIIEEMNGMCFGFPENRIYEDLKTSASYKEKVDYILSKEHADEFNRLFDRIVYQYFKRFRESFAVASFSLSGGHPVMWSHYSSFSTGFVEIFDKNNIQEGIRLEKASHSKDYNEYQLELFNLHEVKYRDHLDSSKFIIWLLKCKDKGSNDIFLKYIKDEKSYCEILNILTTKMNIWQYEREISNYMPFH